MCRMFVSISVSICLLMYCCMNVFDAKQAQMLMIMARISITQCHIVFFFVVNCTKETISSPCITLLNKQIHIK